MTELKIQGMSCSHCSAAVERALQGVAGVTAVEVDLEGGSATVQGAAALADLVAAVTEEGYTATPAS
ncbi:MAG: heavy-metal-associated domain-containing protein [Trueperaceae bacterium]